MTFKVEVTGATQLNKRLEKIKKDLTDPKFMEKITLFAKTEILKQTGQGRDRFGKRFKPYSGGYKKRKSKTGRNPNKVNLRQSSRMLSNMTTKTRSGVGVVFFKSGQENTKAGYHDLKGAGKSKVLREFMGLNRGSEKKLIRLVDNEVTKVIR